MTDPRAGLFFCDHWRCWMSPRACAVRHRAANRKPRWGPSPMNGDYTPALGGNYCGRCEIGRENARREDEMAKGKTKTDGGASPGLRLAWLEVVIGEPLVEEFLRDAEESGRLPTDHLRHVVAEYYYLRELGA